MPKLNFKTHNAILLFWDEEKNEPRKVIFGDPKEAMALFLSTAPIAYQQLQELGAKEYKTEAELHEALKNLSMRMERMNASGAYEDGYIELSYQVHKGKIK